MTTVATPWQIRPLTATDVADLLHVQTVCYGDDFMESEVVFAQRLSCAHHCSLGMVQAATGPLQAYLAAYWSNPGKITPLDGLFAPPAAAQQVLYLHDMSVLPRWAGQGLARQLLSTAIAQAQACGVSQAALVSVQGSQAYWERQGFAVQAVEDVAEQQHLATYGDGAVYMVRAI